jgi:starch-binding outer membrane protein, SusD/RagB family
MNALNKLIIFLLTLCVNVSCKKLVQVDPPATDLVSASAFSNNANAAAVLTGIYASAVGGNSFFTGSNSMSAIGSLSADEMIAYDAYIGTAANQVIGQAYKNSLISSNSPFWKDMYNNIYKANAAIEGLEKSTGVTPEIKAQLTGEAKFFRAFCYFYMVNTFGDVPLITSTDYRQNRFQSRASVQEVYAQIISDLKDAQSSLSEDYVDATHTVTSERVRPNQYAATALLARTYLYMGDWANSEAEATKVINSATYGLSVDPNEVFLMNSMEAIWQLPPVLPDRNTSDGYFFVSTGGPTVKTPMSVSRVLVAFFEPGDLRKDNWIKTVITPQNDTFYYPYKYKVSELNQPVTEYLMILRIAEQYLIRAEARAQQDNLDAAREDLDVIRMRAGLPPTTATTKEAMLLAIENERHAELFTEWGHRWLDLKRTGRINEVMSAVAVQKGVAWSSDKQLFPIPLSEIQTDPKLTQNPGYN